MRRLHQWTICPLQPFQLWPNHEETVESDMAITWPAKLHIWPLVTKRQYIKDLQIEENCT